MAEKGTKPQKPQDAKSSSSGAKETKISNPEQISLPYRNIQFLQQSAGNRAVQRLIQSRNAGQTTSRKKPEPSPLLNLNHMSVQLLRSGRVGRVNYDESPRDMIALRMPFQIGELDTILSNVDRVIQSGFGSSSRTYSGDVRFQLALRSFLESIEHPSMTGGGPAMRTERWLRFRVRLVRGAGDRIERLEFLRPVREIEIETVERVEPRPAEPEPAEEEQERRPTPEPTPEPEAEAEEGGGILSRIASGMEAMGDFSSGRWVWDPINSQLAEWEAELDRIGERREGGIPGQVMLVPVTMLFTILQAIVGTLDLIARINPVNLILQGAATGVRAGTGEYSQEDFLRDAEELGDEALDLITLGLRSAYRHLVEGIEEANVFRITQAVSEIVLAALAIFGIIRGVRARLRARRAARAAEGTTAEGTAEGAPAEGTAEAGTPGAGRPTIRRRITNIEEAQRLRDEYARGRREGNLSESFDPEGFQAEWQHRGGTGRAPPAFVDSTGALIFDAQRVGLIPEGLLSEAARSRRAAAARPAPTETPTIRRPITDPAEAARVRDEIASGRREGSFHESYDPAGFQAEWQHRGGTGPAPPAFVDSSGALMYDAAHVGLVPEGLLSEGVARRGPRAAAPPPERPAAEGIEEAATRPQFQQRIDSLTRARELVREYREGGRRVYPAAHDRAMQGHWERAGGEGTAPVAFTRADGMLIVNNRALQGG